ncbi:MAG: peptidylprolyl isomerase [Saprospiraceae bacterium]|nr:peptidylprolyl isomerase [Saprospiraceae bacterium]
MKINFLHILTIAALTITSCSKPIANFVIKEAEKTAPAKVTFQNKSQKAERYEWDFGDGKKITDSVAQHEYKHSGNYTVILKAYKGKKMSVTKQNIHIDAPLKCLVEIETDYGTMLVELSNATPQHRDNFTKLAEQGFYDGTLFHRIISEFMIQGGDPDSKSAAAGQPLGMGGPGYTVPAEFVDSLVHVKGALAAARMGDAANPKKASSGSQFYIVQGKPVDDAMIKRIEGMKGIHYTAEQKKMYAEIGGTPFLDREYTVFGHVVKGLEVIDKIAAAQKDGRDRPAKDVKMKVRVIK